MENYFVFSLIMSCLFSLRFLRDLAVFWLCLSEEVKTPGPRGRHILATVTDDASGLMWSILLLVTETSAVNIAIETGTLQIIAGVENVRLCALLKLCLLKDCIYNHPN